AGVHNPFWKSVAFYTMAGGTIGALLAAVPGLIDYLSLRDRRRKQVAATHMVLNLIVVGMFFFYLGICYNRLPDDSVFGLSISVAAVILLAVSGWLGGKLVFELGVGVNAAPDEREYERRVA